MYKAGGEKKFDNKLWEAYKEANIKFAEVVSSIYQV
jgi:trehalose-6-phosphate synthase